LVQQYEPALRHIVCRIFAGAGVKHNADMTACLRPGQDHPGAKGWVEVQPSGVAPRFRWLFHSLGAEIGGVPQDCGDECGRVADRLARVQVREALAEAGPAVYLGENVGDADPRQGVVSALQPARAPRSLAAWPPGRRPPGARLKPARRASQRERLRAKSARNRISLK
jgi:hypothetical protein